MTSGCCRKVGSAKDTLFLPHDFVQDLDDSKKGVSICVLGCQPLTYEVREQGSLESLGILSLHRDKEPVIQTNEISQGKWGRVAR